MANGSLGLQVFDVKNPLYPVWITGVDINGKAQYLSLTERHAYVTSGNRGLSVVDISNPFQSKLVGKLDTSDSFDIIRISGKLAYISSNTNGLVLVDIGVPEKPEIIARYNAKINDLWVDGEKVFLATKNNGLQVLDVSRTNHPVLIGQYKNKNYPVLVRSQGKFVFVHEQNRGSRILEINKNKIKEISFLNFDEKINDMKLDQDTLYITVESRGLIAIDISNHESPAIKNIYSSGRNLAGIEIAKNSAFLSGEKIITSIKLLPDVEFKQTTNSRLRVHVPGDMPPGSYHFMIRTFDGKQRFYYNAFKVVLPPRAKPKFTMEDYEKVLKERKKKK